MRRSRVPLTALRSFEAAGRLCSFTQAAEELFVSQAAISRQVRELESFVGLQLFERRHRRVELTTAGCRLLAQLTRSFDEIGQELDALQAHRERRILVVSVEPSFAACWLVPRLESFRLDHPDIDISIEADASLSEFRGNAVEIAIRYGATRSAWPRVQARHLADANAAPVLSPGLLEATSLLAQPEDLQHLTLLHEENRIGWSNWFRQAGASDAAFDRGPLFADTALALQAAARGQGVALADLLLAEEDIAEGRLVKPFEVEIACGAYFLVAPNFDRLSRPAAAFAGWIEAAFHGDEKTAGSGLIKETSENKKIRVRA